MKSYLNYYLLFLLFLPFNGWTQTEIAANKLLLSSRFNINQYFTVLHPDSAQLAPANYKVRYDRPKAPFFLYFTMDENQKVASPILVKNDKDEIMGRLHLENNQIIRTEKFDNKTNQLLHTAYKVRDTVFTINYNIYGNIKSEYRKLNEETFYSKNCSFDEQDSIVNCQIEDKVLGVKQRYIKGVLSEEEITKNLEVNIQSKRTYYSALGEIEKVVFKYKDGKLKVVKKDGSFEMIQVLSGGENVEVYDKMGKLVKSLFLAYPSME
ncbi:hypothetical protein DNU06_01985 [Putridiphycobacter roseus]|uniref:Uncharacterized protein n=1 Tax=Putridiphycobacter roseus TaxID=2219161 RepID=A0A2W1N451_9FLAO|nr:hypothetical protein [Putridiphycobacter roseus]PZE18624.1 hypothetical protein DNU06_01985 [Putridiphycobacter roseus]